VNWKSFGLNTATSILANIAANSIGAYVRTLPEQRISAFLVRFGKAFGPKKLGRHWSELPPEEQAAWLARKPFLAKGHGDYWIKGFQWVPRTMTFWEGEPPTLEDVIVGNVTEMKPIPNDGEWYVLDGYMTSVTVEGFHNRLGWRWDNVDKYYNLSFSVKPTD
jgi:hypothetical protein